MEDTITDLRSFMRRAAEYRAEGDMPVLFVVGRVSRSVEVDGVVVDRVGTVDEEPAYKVVPRMYQILDDGAIQVCDDHSEWLIAGNDEEETIDADDVILAVVAEPMNGDLSTAEGAGNVVVYPGVAD